MGNRSGNSTAASSAHTRTNALKITMPIPVKTKNNKVVMQSNKIVAMAISSTLVVMINEIPSSGMTICHAKINAIINNRMIKTVILVDFSLFSLTGDCVIRLISLFLILNSERL